MSQGQFAEKLLDHFNVARTSDDGTETLKRFLRMSGKGVTLHQQNAETDQIASAIGVPAAELHAYAYPLVVALYDHP